MDSERGEDDGAGEERIRLDLRGLTCPLPVLKTRKALLRLSPGAVIEVTASDPLAAIDLPHFCREAGHDLLRQDRTGADLHFVIRRR